MHHLLLVLLLLNSSSGQSRRRATTTDSAVHVGALPHNDTARGRSGRTQLEEVVARGWKDVPFFRDYMLGSSSESQQPDDAAAVFFWRPQKVGSTTLVALLLTYAYRHRILHKARSTNNYMCRKMALCELEQEKLPGTTTFTTSSYLSKYVQHAHKPHGGWDNASTARALSPLEISLETASELVGPYRMSLIHEVCNLEPGIIARQLSCAFAPLNTLKLPGSVLNSSTSGVTIRASPGNVPPNDIVPTAPIPGVREIFLVRHPLARATSVYYFVGEMQKLWQQAHKRRREGKTGRNRLGGFDADVGYVRTKHLLYHGNETTAPPLAVAMQYARNLPYSRWGPTLEQPLASFTWSLFATSASEACEIIKSDRMLTLITDRYDESLVVLRHYLNWTLADVVVAKSRKALSPHPKIASWPAQAVQRIEAVLRRRGEFSVFDAAQSKLNERILALAAEGVNVTAEVDLLRSLRSRVSELCFTTEYLELYRRHMIRESFPLHYDRENRFRESEDVFTDRGFAFAYNREQLFSFDVCGSCEAEGILFHLKSPASPQNQPGVVNSTTKLLKDIDASVRDRMPEFSKCPSWEKM